MLENASIYKNMPKERGSRRSEVHSLVRPWGLLSILFGRQLLHVAADGVEATKAVGQTGHILQWCTVAVEENYQEDWHTLHRVHPTLYWWKKGGNKCNTRANLLAQGVISYRNSVVSQRTPPSFPFCFKYKMTTLNPVNSCRSVIVVKVWSYCTTLSVHNYLWFPGAHSN